MRESTGMQCKEYRCKPEPWQSWSSTARYLLVRLAQAVSNAVLVWLAYARH